MHVASVMLFEGEPPAYEDVSTALDERLHLVPRYRQKLAWVPLDQGRPVWVDDPHFNLGYHVRHSALPAPGSDEQLAALGGRVFAARSTGTSRCGRSSSSRARPATDAALRDDRQDPPRARRRRLGRRHHDGALRPRRPTRCRSAAPAARWIPRPEPTGVQLLAEALVERASSPAEGAARPRARPRAAAVDPARHGAARRGGRDGLDRHARGAADAAQRPDRAAPALRLGRHAAGPPQGDQERARRDGQRRRADDRGGRARALPAAARLPDRRPRAQGDGAGLRALDRRARRARQPGDDDVRAAADGRGRPARAASSASTRRWATSRSPARPSAPRCSPGWPTSRRRRSSPRPRGCRPVSGSSTSS